MAVSKATRSVIPIPKLHRAEHHRSPRRSDVHLVRVLHRMELSKPQRSLVHSFLPQSRLCNSSIDLSQHVFLPVQLRQRKVPLFSTRLSAPAMDSVVLRASGNNGSPAVTSVQGKFVVKLICVHFLLFSCGFGNYWGLQEEELEK